MKKQISILLIIAAVLILCTGALAAGGGNVTPAAATLTLAVPSTSLLPSELPTTLPSTSLALPSISISPTSTVKTCTCCGATYTGTVCPNCMKTRCSVCNKCPIHCTCQNTELVTDDHFAYINGFTNGTFSPNGNVTRAQAATIFYRLLQNKNYTSSVSFSDVKQGSWYYTAVTCLAAKGIIHGYTDGTFRPGGIVTRAEICAMATQFYSMVDCQIHYTDVPTTHWAYKYIASAVGHGCMNDYVGEFRPDQPMTRMETVMFINNATDREPDKAYIDANIKTLTTFSDVPSTNIAYYEIIEAANGHTCSVSGSTETWTGTNK